MPSQASKVSHAVVARHDEHVGAAPGEQADRHHPRDLIHGGFKGRRVRRACRLWTSRMALPLSVTTPSRQTGCPPSFTSCARDIGASHGNHFDREREGAQHVDQLGVVDDADEALRGGGDDLLAGERGAAALDQRAVARWPRRRRRYRDSRSPGGIEIEFRNARGPQAFGGLARARDCAFELYFTVFQHFYELGHGGARADTQHHAVFDVARAASAARRFFSIVTREIS